jgi:hypothetical protein
MLEVARSDWETDPTDRAAFEWLMVLQRRRVEVRRELFAAAAVRFMEVAV